MGDGAFDDHGDPVGNVAFSMDYGLALDRIKGALTTTQRDLLAALCDAPGCELSGGQIARLLGLTHHVAVTTALVGLAKALTKAVGVPPPKRSNGTSRWWHVVAEGRYSHDRSRFLWKLRPALRDAVVAAGLHSMDAEPVDPTELGETRLFEGSIKIVRVNAYERNPVARRRCIEHYGAVCSVCDVEMASVYGSLAEGVIHVHHLRPISECGGDDYQVDPIEELRPVCPNCHVVLHLRRPPFSIDELRNILAEQRTRLEA